MNIIVTKKLRVVGLCRWSNFLWTCLLLTGVVVPWSVTLCHAQPTTNCYTDLCDQSVDTKSAHLQQQSLQIQQFEQTVVMQANQIQSLADSVQQLAANVHLLNPINETCKSILTKNPQAPSGVYQLIASKTGTHFTAYCEMGLNGGGYIFLHPSSLITLTDSDIQNMIMDTGSFLMRIKMVGGKQPFAVLSNLQAYVSNPLKVMLNSFTSYAGPNNAPILGDPYLFFGFIPAAIAGTSYNNAVQGLMVNGQSLNFTNCTPLANPSNYIALFANFQEKTPSTNEFSDVFQFCNQLLSDYTLPNPSSRLMLDDYFMFLETQWGGCGCFTQTDARLNALGVISAAIGFR